MSKFRDRIVDVRVLKARELTDHEGNWRTHPSAQVEAVEGILHEVGKADVLLAWHSARAGGALTLIDGHLRKALDPEEEWRVAITDLTDEEADKLLLVLDPLAAMAEMDKQKVLALTDQAVTDDLALREVLRRLELEAQRMVEDAEDGEEGKAEKVGPPAMEIMPFEHYDYVMLMFNNELDWLAAVETLGLEKRADKRKTKKIGLCRVIVGKLVIERLRAAEEELAKLKSQQNAKPSTHPGLPPFSRAKMGEGEES
jgi:hypothetical protein